MREDAVTRRQQEQAISLRHNLSRILILKLRQGRIYALPDGSEYLAMASGEGFFLYARSRSSWATDDEPDYEVDAAGRIFAGGQPTAWTVDDLTFTGWTVYQP